MKTTIERIDTILAPIFYSAVVLLLVMSLMACSVKFELGYHGETAKDDKTYTSKSNPAKY